MQIRFIAFSAERTGCIRAIELKNSRCETLRERNLLQEPRYPATDIPLPPLQERMRDGIAASFSLIHGTVSQYSHRMALEMKRYNYVTPMNFIELVVGYGK